MGMAAMATWRASSREMGEGKAKRENWLWKLVAEPTDPGVFFNNNTAWKKILTASWPQIEFLRQTTATSTSKVRSVRFRKHNGPVRPFVRFVWDHDKQAVHVGCLFCTSAHMHMSIFTTRLRIFNSLYVAKEN